MQIFRSLTLLTMFLPLWASAGFEPGVYTTFQRYEMIETDGEKAKQVEEFKAKSKPGGKIRLSTTSNIELIFPSYYKEGTKRNVAPHVAWGNVFQTLMRSEPGQKYVLSPSLTTSFEADPKNKTYRIKLRTDVTFSDGTPFTADDVVFSWNFSKEKIDGKIYAKATEKLMGNPIVKALSKTEVVVKFEDVPDIKQREALFQFMLTTIVKPNKNNGRSPDITIPNDYLGTGPYEVTEAHTQKVRLKRRANTPWVPQGSYNFDEIVIDVYRDLTVARAGLRSHNLDIYYEINAQYEPYLDYGLGPNAFYDKRQFPIDDEDLGQTQVAMNMMRPHMNNLLFRKAMVLAYDFDGPNKDYFHGRQSRLNSMGGRSKYAPKDLPEYPTFRDRRARLRAALNLLKQAGYALENGVLVKDGEPVKLNVLTWGESRLLKPMSVFQKDLAILGIELTIRSIMDEARLTREQQRSEYDFFPAGLPVSRSFVVVNAGTLRYYYARENAFAYNPHGPKLNVNNLVSEKIDELIERIDAVEIGSAEYKELVEEFLREFHAQVPFILSGEVSQTTVYVDKNLCLPPQRYAHLELGYYCH